MRTDQETFERVYTPGDLALPALWREMGAALTCGARAFEDDRARDAKLAAQGWIVFRFTWRQPA